MAYQESADVVPDIEQEAEHKVEHELHTCMPCISPGTPSDDQRPKIDTNVPAMTVSVQLQLLAEL